jgi:two-component system phosphate regulon sensor histidine kinase PhoR
MKRKAILFVVIIVSVSLVGIVLTQLYWVRKSLELKGDQFDNSVRIAIKSVMNQLMEHKNDSLFQVHLHELSCKKFKLDVTDVIEPSLLDSLVFEELTSMDISDRYYYALYNDLDDDFVAGDYKGREEELLNSNFQFSVSSLFKPGDYYLSIYFPAKSSIVLRQVEVWLLFSVFFLIVVIISFAYVVLAILRQKKLSEIKNDFINNMTHEFKTPIATSSLAAEMLMKPEVIDRKDKINKYAKVILDENHRLQGQVEQILQMATLENGQKQFKYKKINLHELLKTVIDSFELRIKENKVRLSIDLEAKDATLVGDRSHISNVFYNLLDNAIKYSFKEPAIQIKTWNVRNGVYVKVKDNGIGISEEYQKNIFKSLFRVPTGNIHEVRGFGLGLYYAKEVVDHHQGRIEINSELGKGSEFDVYLPYNYPRK